MTWPTKRFHARRRPGATAKAARALAARVFAVLLLGLAVGAGEAIAQTRQPDTAEQEGFFLAGRAVFGARPGQDLGGIRTDPAEAGFDLRLLPESALGLAFGVGLEAGHTSVPLTLEFLVDRTNNSYEFQRAYRPQRFRGDVTFRGERRTTTLAAAVRVVSPYSGPSAWPYASVGWGRETATLDPLGYCHTAPDCPEEFAPLAGDRSTSVFRVALGAELPYQGYGIFLEVADLIGHRRYDLGELPTPAYVVVPYRHSVSILVGLRPRLIGPRS